MPCVVCQGYIWICTEGDDELDCDDIELPGNSYDMLATARCGKEWCFRDCGFYPQGEYTVWFLAGEQGGNCNALLLDAGDLAPSNKWKQLQTKTLGPGYFELWCKKGGGRPPFMVAVKAVLECPEAADP